MEVLANDIFNGYREMYYEGGASSVYFWDLDDDAFAACVLFKKGALPLPSPRLPSPRLPSPPLAHLRPVHRLFGEDVAQRLSGEESRVADMPGGRLLGKVSRDASATSDAAEARKAAHTKLSSCADARATPPTIGSSESHTRRDEPCRRSRPESKHAHTGPADLTTCRGARGGLGRAAAHLGPSARQPRAACTNETEPTAVANTPAR